MKYKLKYDDYKKCYDYSRANPSDPFSYNRAVSRLENFGPNALGKDDSGHIVID